MPADDKQMLTVSSPCLLLNHIAQRYTRTSRIIMEYVDNSLDDCEVLYNKENNEYSRPIEVHVRIDRQKSKKAAEGDAAANAAQVAVPATDKEEAPQLPPVGGARKKKPRKDDDKVTVSVTDNCRGMTKAVLSRLVVNVGESNKRASKFTNGQFGFGVHAFRAAASRIEFKTKAQGAARTLSLAINRKSEFFPHPKPVKKEEENGIQTDSGTEVTVSGFDNTWSEQLDPKEIIKEIEHHFSGLLERENLKVTVTDVAKEKTVECQPFSFAQGTTKRLIKDYPIEGEDVVKDAVLRVRLYISSKPKHNKNCMFVCKGRRINEISDVKSFMKMSRCRWAVWGHPNLVGYIDVSGILEPVITRDEFILNKTRKDVYRKIIDEIEGDLYKKLHEVNENRRVMALAKLEDVVSRCVNVAVKKDSKRSKEGISYLEQLMMAKKPIRRRKIDEDFDVMDDSNAPSRKRKRLGDDDDDENKDKTDKDEENPAKKRKNRGLGFNIAFVKELVDEEKGIPLRARLVGEDVQINMKHPDFLQRIKVSKAESQPIVTERLCGYLANIIANAYKSHTLLRGGGIERYKDDHTLLLEEILDVTFSLEGQLRSKLKLMQREMDAGTSMMRPMGPPPVEA